MADSKDGNSDFDSLIFAVCMGSFEEFGRGYYGLVSGGSDLVPNILKVLEQPNGWTDRFWRQAAEEWENADDEMLEQLIYDGALTLRRWLIKALGEIGDRRAAPSIISLLENPSRGLPSAQTVANPDRSQLLLRNIRDAAVGVLGKLRDERAVPVLLRVVPEKSDYHVLALMNARASFKQVLSDESRVSDWLQYLKNYIPNPVSHYRPWAIKILGKIGTPKAVTILTETLTDTTVLSSSVYADEGAKKRICDYAAESLELIATPEALESLRRWRG